MAKYSKVYLRNKKESNISKPLRYSFLRSIFVDQMSVKNAAIKWKIHYSTAKIIARQAKRSNTEIFFGNWNTKEKQAKVCNWKEVNSYSIEFSEAFSYKSETNQDMVGNTPMQTSSFAKNKITIITTIGWNFHQNEILDHLNE